MYELVDSVKHYTLLGTILTKVLLDTSQSGQQATTTQALFGFTYNLSRSGSKWCLVVTYGDMGMNAYEGWLNLHWVEAVRKVLGPSTSITCDAVSDGMVIAHGTIHR